MARLLRTLQYIRMAIAALGFLAATPALSRADAKLDVITGFDNNFRVGAWTPMQIRISGVGGDTNAHVQIMVRTQAGTQVYGKNVRLRAGAVNGPYTIYYLQPELTQSKDITIQVSAEGRTLIEKQLDQVGSAIPIPEGEPIIIGLTQDQSGLNFLAQLNLAYIHTGIRADEYQNYNYNGFSNGLNRPTFNKVIYPKAPNLPDSANGYEALDAAVLGDLPLDLLNEDQWSALVGWVKTGGVLVVSGSADLNRLRSKQLADILPVEPAGVKQMSDFEGLKYQYGSAPKTRSSSVVVSKLKPDALALCTQGDLPLVVERRLGSGLVVFTSFDLLAPEFRAWPGQAGMWAEIMRRGGGSVKIAHGVRAATEPSFSNTRWGGYNNNSNHQLTDALAGVQSTEAPSFRAIGFFLILYIVLLVPVPYLLLKRWDRKELAWITMPAIIVLFSVGAYAVGYSIKGGQLYLHYCSILEGAANSDGWQAYSVGSIFSPRQARYDLSIADPAAMVMEVTEGGGQQRGGMGDIVIDRGESKTVVKSALVNMWDHRQFDFQSFVTLGGQVAASVQPSGDNGAVVTVSNGTRMPLTECLLSYGGSSALVGTLAPGDTKTVKISLVNTSGGTGINIIGAGQTSNKAVKEIRDALATLAGTAGNYTQSPNQFINPNNPNQPVVAQKRTPFVLTGWFEEPAVGLALDGETPVVSGANLLVVHLPLPEGHETAPPPSSTTPPPGARRDPFSGQGFNRRVRPGMMGGGGPTTTFAASNLQADSHNANAYQYANQGDLENALKEANLALKAAPTSANILDTVGEMHQRRKEYAKAAPYYKQAIHLLPAGQATETEAKYGQMLLDMGQKKEAVKHLQIAARDYSGNTKYGAVARQTLARILPAQTAAVANLPLTRLSQGQAVPSLPTNGKGARRILQPLAGGGSYYIVQQWDYTAGANTSSSSIKFLAAGQ